MKSKAQHWDAIYSRKKDQELGWFEPDFLQTLEFLKPAGQLNNKRIFVAGAGTSKLANQLCNLGAYVVLNDISESALDEISKDLPNGQFTTLQHDLSKPLLEIDTVNHWIDRAVLHFLLDEKEIEQYFLNVKACVKIGGYVFLAQFSEQGATKCAGLPIKQYNIDTMTDYLGSDFRLVNSQNYVFLNPFGDEKPYVYGLFQRVSCDEG